MSEDIKYTSFHDYGVTADKGSRRKMEDKHVVVDSFTGNSQMGFFGVYDGHGGTDASRHTEMYLHLKLADELMKLNTLTVEGIKNSLIIAYEMIDNELISTLPVITGTCAVTVLITSIGEERWLISANVGDSRSILLRNNTAIRLSYDHKPGDPSEMQRIIDSGGFVRDGRVNGILGVSRSLGDRCVKKYTISTPYVNSIKFTPEDSYLILACDGIWDVISDDELISILDLENDPNQSTGALSSKIVKEAKKRSSHDNLTAIVVKL